MTTNPYAPPGAAVRHVPDPARQARPRSVVLAVLLLAVDIPLQAAVVLLTGDGPARLLVSLAAIAVLLALTLVLYWCIWRGHNWARLTLTALVAVSAVTALTDVSALPLVRLLTVASYGLEIGAVYLLLRPESSRWFRRV